MSGRDIKNEIYWQHLNGEKFRTDMSRKRKNTDRFRFVSRGEAISNEQDILKIKDIVLTNSEITFWVPTRAWRSNLRSQIESDLFPIGNLRVTASLDPSNSNEEMQELSDAGWGTTFFGNNETYYLEDVAIKCIKTWDKKRGIKCYNCENGCYNINQAHVWFKQH